LYNYKNSQPGIGVLQGHLSMGKSAKYKLLTAILYFKCFANLSSSYIKLFFSQRNLLGNTFSWNLSNTPRDSSPTTDLLASGDFHFVCVKTQAWRH